MANPKHRMSKRRKNERRSHDALTAVSLTICRNCAARIRPHRVCPQCGYYKAHKWQRPVISVDIE